MAISFNTGTKGDSGGVAAASQTLTIPAGVLAGDVVIFVAAAFAGASGATLSASSTGTAPVLKRQAQTASFAGNFLNGGYWEFIASATDTGKVITITLSGGTNPFWAAALGAWTGASSTAPVDVDGVNTATGASITDNCPALTTGVAGDWAVYMAAAGMPSQAINEPAATISRQKDTATSNICADICDSNASVGPAGTGIGGAAFTYSAGAAGNCWYVVFTVGLAPPASTSSTGLGIFTGVISAIAGSKAQGRKHVISPFASSPG